MLFYLFINFLEIEVSFKSIAKTIKKFFINNNSNYRIATNICVVN